MGGGKKSAPSSSSSSSSTWSDRPDSKRSSTDSPISHEYEIGIGLIVAYTVVQLFVFGMVVELPITGFSVFLSVVISLVIHLLLMAIGLVIEPRKYRLDYWNMFPQITQFIRKIRIMSSHLSSPLCSSATANQYEVKCVEPPPWVLILLNRQIWKHFLPWLIMITFFIRLPCDISLWVALSLLVLVILILILLPLVYLYHHPEQWMYSCFGADSQVTAFHTSRMWHQCVHQNLVSLHHIQLRKDTRIKDVSLDTIRSWITLLSNLIKVYPMKDTFVQLGTEVDQWRFAFYQVNGVGQYTLTLPPNPLSSSTSNQWLFSWSAFVELAWKLHFTWIHGKNCSISVDVSVSDASTFTEDMSQLYHRLFKVKSKTHGCIFPVDTNHIQIVKCNEKDSVSRSADLKCRVVTSDNEDDRTWIVSVNEFGEVKRRLLTIPVEDHPEDPSSIRASM